MSPSIEKYLQHIVFVFCNLRNDPKETLGIGCSELKIKNCISLEKTCNQLLLKRMEQLKGTLLWNELKVHLCFDNLKRFKENF